MTAGTKALRKIQLGREATAGTAVAATAIWRGMGTIEDTLQQNYVNEDVGVLAPPTRTNISFLGGKLELEEVEATFEQICHIFEAGIKLVGTGVADGTGSGKIYNYPMHTTTRNAIKTYSIEGGDDQGAERMEYSFVESFKITGKARESVKMSAVWVGRQVQSNAFTALSTLTSVEDMIFAKSKLYLDPVTGTHGATQKSETLMELSLEITTGWQIVPVGDGNLYFATIKPVKPKGIATVTFEHDATSIAEKAFWRAQTPRLLRWIITGNAFTTAGTTYPNKTFIVDLAGTWSKFDKIGEADGNDIVSGKFNMGYDATVAMAARFLVVNALATVP